MDVKKQDREMVLNTIQIPNFFEDLNKKYINELTRVIQSMREKIVIEGLKRKGYPIDNMSTDEFHQLLKDKGVRKIDSKGIEVFEIDGVPFVKFIPYHYESNINPMDYNSTHKYLLRHEFL